MPVDHVRRRRRDHSGSVTGAVTALMATNVAPAQKFAGKPLALVMLLYQFVVDCCFPRNCMGRWSQSTCPGM